MESKLSDEFEKEHDVMVLPKQSIISYLDTRNWPHFEYDKNSGLYKPVEFILEENIARDLNLSLNPPKSSYCIAARSHNCTPKSQTMLESLFVSNGFNIIDYWIVRSNCSVSDIRHAMTNLHNNQEIDLYALGGYETYGMANGIVQAGKLSQYRIADDEYGYVAKYPVPFNESYGYGSHPLIPELFTEFNYYAFLHCLLHSFSGYCSYIRYSNEESKRIVLLLLKAIYGNHCSITTNADRLINKADKYTSVKKKHTFVVIYVLETDDIPYEPHSKTTYVNYMPFKTKQIILGKAPMNKIKCKLYSCHLANIDKRCSNHFVRVSEYNARFRYAQLNKVDAIEIKENDVTKAASLILSHAASLNFDMCYDYTEPHYTPILNADNEDIDISQNYVSKDEDEDEDADAAD